MEGNIRASELKSDPYKGNIYDHFKKHPKEYTPKYDPNRKIKDYEVKSPTIEPVSTTFASLLKASINLVKI